MKKEDTLNRFVAKLQTDPNVLSIILFGSYARGNSRPDSDIDLVVILKEGYKRAAEIFEGQAFEIIYTTEKSALEYWQSHKYDAVGLWTVAKVIFDREGAGERLQVIGKKMCEELPPEVSKTSLAHFQFDAEDSLKAIEAIMKKDPATASLLVHKKVADLIDLFFDLERKWRPAPKQSLERVRIVNEELGKSVDAFYTEPDLEKRISIAKEISSMIFKNSSNLT